MPYTYVVLSLYYSWSYLLTTTCKNDLTQTNAKESSFRDNPICSPGIISREALNRTLLKRVPHPTHTHTCVQALSDVDEEGESGPNSGREVIIDGHGLVTLCPDLGYYDGPAGARRNYGAAYAGLSDGPSPSMQVRSNA